LSRDADRKEPMDRKTGYLGGFSPEVRAWMYHRTNEIYRATQRRGMPYRWGEGKGPVKVPPMPPRSQSDDDVSFP